MLGLYGRHPERCFGQLVAPLDHFYIRVLCTCIDNRVLTRTVLNTNISDSRVDNFTRQVLFPIVR